MLSIDEREDFRKNQLMLDCPKITIRKGDNTNSKLEGCGSIFQLADGTLNFKIYCLNTDVLRESILHQNILPGQIIPESEHFNLTAIDKDDRKWTAKNTSFSLYAKSKTKFTVISGRANSIISKTKSTHPHVGNYASLQIFQKVEIPTNTATKVTTFVKRQEMHSRMSLNAAKISTPNHSFLLWYEEDILNISYHTKKPVGKLPTFFNTRVIEALSFILAYPLEWSLSETTNDNSTETILKAKPLGENDQRLYPPIRLNGPGNSNRAVWDLFKRYLRYIESVTSETWHPISQRVFSILQASAGSLETQGLTLGVETEGLIKDHLAKRYEISSKLKRNITKLKKHIKKLPIEESLKNRFLGSIGNFLQIRPGDVLKDLSKSNFIHEDYFKAWKDLRNSSAHANAINSCGVQKYVDLCNKTTTLFYQLIFLIIRYKGFYTNYGTRGFSDAYFNPKRQLRKKTLP